MEKRDLLPIGKMADLNHVSIATLRLYDKMNLLKPVYVDEDTGYRYYDMEQNARMDMIAYMKELGMSLTEIESVLSREDITLIEEILVRKNEQIHEQIRELRARHDAVERTIASIERYRKSPVKGTISSKKTVDEKPAKPVKKKKEKKAKEDAGNEKPKKKTGLIILLSLLMVLIVACIVAAVYLFVVTGKKPSGGSINDSALTSQQTVQTPEEPAETPAEDTSRVVIKLKNNVGINQQITEADIEGVKLTDEQWEKYNNVSTYIDAAGQLREETLLLWADKDKVIGKYSTRELTAGTVLYDTAITTEHVEAEKTFVDVEVDGEGNTYEVESKVLPGNTRIQIVAIVQTDGENPQQILLSEMMLQDRSLQSIFDSAGQDILEMLSSAESQTTEETDSEGDDTAGADTAEANESEGE